MHRTVDAFVSARLPRPSRHLAGALRKLVIASLRSLFLLSVVRWTGSVVASAAVAASLVRRSSAARC